MTSLLFKGGVLITSKGQEKMDILVKEGKVEAMGREEKMREIGHSLRSCLVDCTGFFIFANVTDGHVHFREPGATQKENFETGSRAAAAGGITTVLDMPNNQPPVTSRAALAEKRLLISKKAYVNYGLYMGATFDPATGHTNIDEYLASDAVALKVYMGSSTGNLLVDQPLYLEEIFKKAAEKDRLIVVHAEDEALMKENLKRFEGLEDPTLHSKIRDGEVAYRSMKLALHLAKKYSARMHIAHLSTARELEEFAKFKNDRISCEVSPHHLFLTEAELAKQGNFAKMNPPLRTEADCKALLEGIRSGLVDMVATDHAPHTMEEKKQPYSKAPSGVPGEETMLPLLLDAVHHGDLTLEQVARVVSEGPARVFQLKSGGALKVGGVANFTGVDMTAEHTVENGGYGARYTKCGWSVYAGRTLRGWPVLAVVNGKIVFQGEKVLDGKAGGKEIGGF